MNSPEFARPSLPITCRMSATLCSTEIIALGPPMSVFTQPGLKATAVKTDMGGANAPLEAKDSVGGMRNVIAKLTLKDSGSFLDYHGKELPW